MNQKLKLVGVVLGIVVLVGLVGYAAKAVKSKDSLYAVSTTSGQFFVGNLSWRPFSNFIKLDNPFVLQNYQDDENNIGSQLIDLSVESQWLPKTIYINLDNVSLKGKVDPSSPIAQKISEYRAGRTTPPAPQPAPAPAQ